MGKVNMGRVILGGFAAGVVINLIEAVLNVFVLADEFGAAMRAMGKSGDISTVTIVFFNLLGFAVGIVTVWLYAAIRTRFGAGPRTAIRAGLWTWAMYNLLPSTGLILLDLFPQKIMVTGMIVGMIELILAAVVGAWLYKEE